MTKKYKLNKILLFSVFSFVLMLAGINFIPSHIAYADTAVLTTQSIKIFDRTGGSVAMSPVDTTSTLSGYTIYTYNWEECSKINISFTNEKISNDNVSLQIELLKGYVSNNIDYVNDAKISIENVAGGSVNAKTFTYDYNIDTGVTDSSSIVNKTIKDWGIYRFTIKIEGEGQEYVSDLYNIAPKAELIKPTFSVTNKGSTSSMSNDYVCTIINQDDFKFADTSKITWYAEGVSVEGKSYCLTLADKNTGSVSFDDYLYTSIERTGLNFIFNTHKGEKHINGSWKVYCIYQPDESLSIESDKIDIKSGLNFNLSIFIICVVVTILVAIGIVVLWEFIKTKKEKVW